MTFTDTSAGTVARRSWDFDVTGGRAPSGATVRYAWSSPGFYEVSLNVAGAGAESTASRVFLVEAADPVGTCEPGPYTLCLRESRYQVRATWTHPDGEVLAGGVVHAGTNDSGLLYFPSRENWEVLVKVLDGCSFNGRDWVFLASATTLEYEVTVTDTTNGETWEYGNEPGTSSPAATDTTAFPGNCDGEPEAASPEPGTTANRPPPWTAVEDTSEGGVVAASPLLLQEGRFEVRMEWSTAEGLEGAARPARPDTVDSGLFWFFEPDNWEVLIKVLDGCWFNGHYWVYAASATDVGLDIAVTDMMTGDVRRYTKSPGLPAPALTDAAAFPNSCRP
ncbi:MAG: PKD domain-containing protein [Holophagales bacterium]|nr:PKD domain-containing protein [Holophagales bacterium]MYG30314.1 PKD domain-containing protein [Holophagales bacterium]MYI80943.1 PKD domain-containing protein [Holophagales bacterium]